MVFVLVWNWGTLSKIQADVIFSLFCSLKNNNQYLRETGSDSCAASWLFCKKQLLESHRTQ